MATNTPKDNYHAVWITFFILGLGGLLPWSYFVTATMYFTSRLKDPSTNGGGVGNGTADGGDVGNGTAVGGDTRNTLESIFSNAITLSSIVPQLIFSCLNSFIHQRIPQKLRISGSLAAILVVFLLTVVLVKVEMAPTTFFCLTIIKIICINSFGAIFLGSLYGLAGLMPVSYTTPIVSGEGLAGIVAAVSMICALATASSLQDSAFGYFITACVVILLAILSYLALPSIEFFRYYMENNRLRESTDQENKRDTPDVVVSTTEEEDKPVVSVFAIFKQIRVIALSLCFNYTITISMFPAVTVDVQSTIADGGAWDTYFIPVSCFLLCNVMDTVGRSLTGVCKWPRADSIWLPILVGVRVVFVPLLMLCNVQPRRYLPVWFAHDSWYILFMMLFAFSSGYLVSLCFCYAPKMVAQHEAETTGAIMIFFLSLGMTLGSAFSFAFRAMI